ncbi:MAG: aminoacyl-tRNA hydrolase [Erysipelotrichaceae bacterium]
MKLIIGLGNPGKEYEKTRHNTGFVVLDAVAKELNIEVNQKKFKALIGVGNVKGEKIILMKPQTYMNLSGEALILAIKFYQIDPNDLLIIYDDLDLPVGKIRLREEGSAGGQNGIKSIIAHLHSQAFKRIRVGIDHNKMIPTADYVLGKFRKDELEAYQEAILKARDAAIAFINKPFSDVMSIYNRK